MVRTSWETCRMRCRGCEFLSLCWGWGCVKTHPFFVCGGMFASVVTLCQAQIARSGRVGNIFLFFGKALCYGGEVQYNLDLYQNVLPVRRYASANDDDASLFVIGICWWYKGVFQLRGDSHAIASDL